jgi:hypothetical protein
MRPPGAPREGGLYTGTLASAANEDKGVLSKRTAIEDQTIGFRRFMFVLLKKRQYATVTPTSQDHRHSSELNYLDTPTSRIAKAFKHQRFQEFLMYCPGTYRNRFSPLTACTSARHHLLLTIFITAETRH